MPATPQVLGYGLPAALRARVDRHQAARAKTTADRSIARRLHDGLEASDLRVRGLSFYVSDGALSIYGAVASADEREALLALCTRVPGIRRIVDHLRIGPDA